MTRRRRKVYDAYPCYVCWHVSKTETERVRKAPAGGVMTACPSGERDNDA